MGVSISVGVLALVVVLCVRWVVNSIRITQFKRQHACEPEVKIHQSERILGYGLFKIQIQASKDRKILEVGRQRYLDYGNTWSAYMMGKVNMLLGLSGPGGELTI